MREKQWILMDNLKRQIFIKYELKKVILTSLIKNTHILTITQYHALYKKSRLNRWSTINQQVNRCFKSGRPFAVNRLTRYSRFVFRRETYQGNVPGFKRASW